MADEGFLRREQTTDDEIGVIFDDDGVRSQVAAKCTQQRKNIYLIYPDSECLAFSPSRFLSVIFTCVVTLVLSWFIVASLFSCYDLSLFCPILSGLVRSFALYLSTYPILCLPVSFWLYLSTFPILCMFISFWLCLPTYPILSLSPSGCIYLHIPYSVCLLLAVSIYISHTQSVSWLYLSTYPILCQSPSGCIYNNNNNNNNNNERISRALFHVKHVQLR